MSDDLEDDLRIAVMRLSRRMRLERVDGDVTDGQLSALFVVAKNGAQTLSSLSEHERVSLPSMNRTVNMLVDAGLLARENSPDDGRKVLISLTASGDEIVTETKRRRVAWFSRRLAELTPAQREAIYAATPALSELADS